MGTRHWPEDANEAVEKLEKQLLDAQTALGECRLNYVKAYADARDYRTVIEGAIELLSELYPAAVRANCTEGVWAFERKTHPDLIAFSKLTSPGKILALCKAIGVKNK